MLVRLGHSLRQAQGWLCTSLARHRMRMPVRQMLVRVLVVRMRMRMLLFLFPEFLPRQILLAIHPDIHLRSRNSAAHDAGNLQLRSNVERGDSPLQQRGRNPGIHKGAHKHIAAYAGKTLKVGYAHRSQFTTELRSLRKFLAITP